MAGKFIRAGGVVAATSGNVLVSPFPGGGVLYSLTKSEFDSEYTTAFAHDTTDQSSLDVPSQAEMLAHWESKIKSSNRIYRKMATLHARLAEEGGVLETIVGGVTEARKSYEKGDFILIGSRGGSYSMRAVDFSSRYDRLRPEPASEPTLASEGFRRYQPIGEVFAHKLLAEDIQRLPSGKFMGKWGAPVSVAVGDYLVCPHPEGGEIYSIKRDLFHKSYIQRPVSDVHIPLEAEILSHWEKVLRQDGHLCRKKRTVYAKVADEDGKLDQISTTQTKPSNRSLQMTEIEISVTTHDITGKVGKI